MIPSISTTNGVPSMYQALAFIVIVSALRAASEDWAKHKEDANRNDKTYLVQRADGPVEVASGNIRVGDIVKVLKDEMIPCDMLFLASSAAKGHCFIDKANLNGETTLEVLSSMTHTKGYFHGNVEENMKTFDCKLTYEPPNPRFDSFRGQMLMDDGTSKTLYSVDGKSLLMRETNLRNVDHIYGLVVYNGDHTKIQVSNSLGEQARTKISKIMRAVNTYLKVLFFAQFILCAKCGIITGVWYDWYDKMWYLKQDSSGFIFGLETIGTWYILLSQMVPISLIVSAEMVKFSQSGFINWDIRLYYGMIDKPAKCNSSTIHEDLGMIDYIFSDKTGTLTQNKMQFRYALLRDSKFGSKMTDIAKSVQARQDELRQRRAGTYTPKTTAWTDLAGPLWSRHNEDPNAGDCCKKNCAGSFNKCWGKELEAPIVADEDSIANEFTSAERQELLQALWGPGDAEQKLAIRRYMTHMALSNTVKPYYHEGELKFQAESAEELANVLFAQSLGFLKKSQNPVVLEITEYNETLSETNLVVEEYNHVATMGFTSKRARVSVVLQCTKGNDAGKVHVMLKGQDSVVLPLLRDTDGDSALMHALKDCYTNGLRTLVAGYAIHDESWWAEKAARYQEVVTMDATDASEGHPSKCSRAPLCHKCVAHEYFEELEEKADFKYLGCMGLEDQLQLLVPQTIADCLRADIKVWMITGDKLETAKNIGLACNLIDPDMIASINPNASVEEASASFADARLIEVTGHWAHLVASVEELDNLFNIIDSNGNGRIDKDELVVCLKAMNTPFDLQVLDRLLETYAGENPEEAALGLNKQQFINLIQSTKMSMFDAVSFDIVQGFKRYERIEDHEMYPVSILINRAAFQVMFPAKKRRKRTLGMRGEVSQEEKDQEEKLEVLRRRFFRLAAVAKSVVFARAEPAMKKKMVTEIIARVPEATTLAIGDGANDTDMITAAHVGVGIAGVEGTAATNSADYAIGTFRMLHTLLFVHGFWNYHRVSDLVNFIFYKAQLLALSSYCYGFVSGFSGQQFFNDPIYQLYNVCYTALPVLSVAILGKALPSNMLENNPIVYRDAKGKAFSVWIFLGWLVRAWIHVVVIVVLPFYSASDEDGMTSLWYASTIVYYCIGIVPSLMIVFLMTNFSMIHFLSIFPCSLGSIFLFNYFLGHWLSYNPDLYGVIDQIYKSPSAWLIILLTCSIPLLMELALRGINRHLRPTLTEILQEKYRKAHLERAAQHQDKAELTNLKKTEAGRASKQILIKTEDAKKWQNIHRSSTSKQEVHGSKKARLSIMPTLAESKMDEPKLQDTVAVAMMRFKNLTGGQFNATPDTQQYLKHDTFASGGDKPTEMKVATE